MPAFVMNIFEPFTTQESSRSSAVVRAAPASEPASGSVSPKAAHPAAGGEVGQPARLLLVRAEEVDRHRPQRGVRRDRDRDRRVDARQLLDRERVADRVTARAAVLLGEGDPHEPQLRHLADELDGETALAVELLGDRRDALAGERADGVADQLVLGRQVEVHAGGHGRRVNRYRSIAR